MCEWLNSVLYEVITDSMISEDIMRQIEDAMARDLLSNIFFMAYHLLVQFLCSGHSIGISGVLVNILIFIK